VDVVNSCTKISPLDPAYYAKTLLYDNVLTGDFERIVPDKLIGNYAGGNPLVHIRAIPEGGPAGSAATGLPYTFYDRMTPSGARHIDRRQPLPSTFAARFIEGGTAAFHTEYTMWREAATAAAAGCVSANASVPYLSIVRYDEYENPTVGAGARTFPVAAAGGGEVTPSGASGQAPSPRLRGEGGAQHRVRGAFALIVLLLAINAPAATRTIATANAASCDIGTYAAATLLLPYFEVEYDQPQSEALNTVFTVINTSSSPQIVRVTIWTDWGFPAAFFAMFLTGY